MFSPLLISLKSSNHYMFPVTWMDAPESKNQVSASSSLAECVFQRAMVNLWSITHDPNIWESPHEFRPERFVVSEGREEVDVRGNDLRLAPFGAGRRVCPGKALGLATVNLWVAKLLHHFEWLPHAEHPVDLSEVLKLSCEMAHPLHCVPVIRVPFAKSSD